MITAIAWIGLSALIYNVAPMLQNNALSTEQYPRGTVLTSTFTANRLILLKVNVNKDHAGMFVLDTAAPNTHLDIAFAKKCGIEPEVIPVGQVQLLPSRVQWAGAVEVTIAPDITVPLRRVGVMDLRNKERAIGRYVDGILGLDAIDKLCLWIDYHGEEVRVLPHVTAVGPTAAQFRAFPFRAFIDSYHLGVQITLGDREKTEATARLIFDTAAAVPIAIFPESKAAEHIRNNNPALIESSRWTWNGVVRSCSGVCDLPMMINDLSCRSAVEIIPRLESVSVKDDGILGAAWLASFSPVILDFPRDSFVLSTVGKRIDFVGGRCRGATLRTTLDGMVEVVGLATGSTALASGLLPGDYVTRVDERAVDAAGVYWIPKYFDKNRDREIRVIVSRGSQQVELNIGAARSCFE